MIISPPLLISPPSANQSDDDWIDGILPLKPASAEFPVMDTLAWHGGYHVSPINDGALGSPIRAIADGIIVLARKSSDAPATNSPPLKYNGQTDDGVVVIQHKTEIGEGVEVVFYSVYMHLGRHAALDGTIQTGKKVYRKQEIGVVGIAASENLIHMEIICDDANLVKLTGRSGGDLPLGDHGRNEVVYGDIHFYVPNHTKFYKSAHSTSPLVYTSEAPLFIALRFDKGNAFLTTRKETAGSNGLYEEVGDTPKESTHYEYDLYKTATHLATSTVAASAVYELLRFGRILDTAVETSNVSGVEHWHEVNLPEGKMGYVNLNTAGIKVFSDGDFPHWMGWNFINDDNDLTSQCKSDTIKKWCKGGDGAITHDEMVAALTQVNLLKRLSKTICRFPTEWSKDQVDIQYSWLKTSSEVHPEAFNLGEYDEFTAHVKALSFWESLVIQDGVALPEKKHWHFHPREFIKHFRRCGWLSKEELAQCIPRRSLVAPDLSWASALSRSQQNYIALNKYFQKYLGHPKARLIHSLAQIYIETGLLGLMNEGGVGNGHPYTAFYGRGYMQLTWASNYANYGEYRNLPQHTGAYSDSRITTTSMHPKSDGGALMRWYPRYDPKIISELAHAGDSSGFYWITKHFKGISNINRVCDLPLKLTTVGFVCWLVNGGGNGYSNRHQFAKYLQNILLDDTPLEGSVSFTYPPLTPHVNIGTVQHPNMVPLLCSHYPPVEVPYSLTGTVHYDKQKP
jgi:predicted chitinase